MNMKVIVDDPSFRAADPIAMVRARDEMPREYIAELPEDEGQAVVPGGVLSPCYSIFPSRHIGMKKGMNVCVMNSGAGALPMLCAKRGAARVVATDFRPEALEAAARTMERNGVETTVDVVATDGPDQLPEGCFDRVVFQCPWIDTDPPNELAEHPMRWEIYDKDFACVRKFLKSVSSRWVWEKGDRFCLVFSPHGKKSKVNYVRLKKIVENAGLEIAQHAMSSKGGLWRDLWQLKQRQRVWY